MFDPNNFRQNLTSVDSTSFESAALKIFEYQYNRNHIYQQYCNFLNKTPLNTKRLTDIPFLPIEFFKHHRVVTGEWVEDKIYQSSGTTSDNRSKHFVQHDQHYLENCKLIFEQQYGSLSDYRLIALLPSYLDQGDSSLVSMIDYFMNFTQDSSCYALNKHDEVIKLLASQKRQKTILFGVTYALLDLADSVQTSLPSVWVFETGGMKGRRKEITRAELHSYLQQRLNPHSIHSEYGMTELSSQAYSNGAQFSFPDWCDVLVRDTNDPFAYMEKEKTGGLNIIDLANINSCAFIETKDLGKKLTDSTFEVLGRFDNSDIRGCNLLG